MTEPKLSQLIEDDGSVSLIDTEEFDNTIRTIFAHLIALTPADRKHPASDELRRVWATTRSTAYVREVTRIATALTTAHLIDEASTFVMTIALKNLNHFLLAYRTLRAAPALAEGEDTPTTKESK